MVTKDAVTMVADFDEPSGATADAYSDVLYIADTNNNTVKVSLTFDTSSRFTLPTVFVVIDFKTV